MAYKHIQLLLKTSIGNNLFDSHPPFQIDGNFGYTAGVSEMLLQSHEENTIRILPAIPKHWKNGHVKGLKARAGLTVDLSWSNNRLDKAILNAKNTTKFNLIYQDKVVPIAIKKGDSFTYIPIETHK